MHNKLAAPHPNKMEHKGVVIDRDCESANRATGVSIYLKLKYPAEVWVQLRTKAYRCVTTKSLGRLARRVGR